MLDTLSLLKPSAFPAIKRGQLKTLQVNLGYLCNQRCLHCHVNASPNRTEIMDAQTCEQILNYLQNSSVQTLDITGGAPELNPHFRYLVQQARQMEMQVIDRCNLTILTAPEQTDLAEFLAAHQVAIVASLPCYLEENVDKQRGNGIFQNSIAGIRQLNALGYGQPHSHLILNLVYNPQGPNLPPAQESLEADYRDYLASHYGVIFNHLYTLCNMPIQRFGSALLSQGQFHNYLQLLRSVYKPEHLEKVMCRSLISVNWQGYVYDCDFNQMLELPLYLHNCQRRHISELVAENLEGNPITVAEHCYGCTAGQGSSCGGALV